LIFLKETNHSVQQKQRADDAGINPVFETYCKKKCGL
jgi:hypothetical protein